ncbi:hypothetical protein KC669_03045 [Candidatus Dojkabacteria bacterium]|uniref:Uncharacterized protein n=1 Tax=Candidatus Dojkabacteria bacterium TaxID=2099670 RepID=A0A955LA90_9BACT|nr:hypothetical protein [Candidatus Dojkabacteria bacterium]
MQRLLNFIKNNYFLYFVMMLLFAIIILVVVYNLTVVQPEKQRQQQLQENPPETFINNEADPVLDGESYDNDFETLFNQLPIQRSQYIMEQDGDNILITVKEDGNESIFVGLALSYIESFGIDPNDERIIIRLI